MKTIDHRSKDCYAEENWNSYCEVRNSRRSRGQAPKPSHRWLVILLIVAAPGALARSQAASNTSTSPVATIGPSTRSANQLPAFSAGADISYYGYIEHHGGAYRIHGKTLSLPVLFKSAGCNTLRLRLWHKADKKEVSRFGKMATLNNLSYTLPLAVRIKRSGSYFVLNMHFSDTWADPGKQYTPAAWKGLSYSQLKSRVHAYAKRVIARFRSAGAMPNMVMVGNEINNGWLWPEGRLWHHGHARWGRFSGLLKAAISGVRAGSGKHQPLIMLQVGYFSQSPHAPTFFKKLIDNGVRFDVIGFDYYPYWDGPLRNLRTRLNALARKVRKPIIVAETAYPWTGNHYNHSWAVKPGMQFLFSAVGQEHFIESVTNIVKHLPNGLGRGVWWWGAEYNADQKNFRQNPWSYRSLFNAQGEALPALTKLCSEARGR